MSTVVSCRNFNHLGLGIISVRFLKQLLIVNVFIFLSLNLAGCVYLRNESLLKTANDASTKLAAFRQNTSTPYQTMLANQQKVQAAFEQDFQRQSALHVTALALLIPGYTWKQIGNEIDAFDKKHQELLAKLNNRLQTALTEDNTIKGEVTLAQAKIDAIDKEIKSTVDEQNILEASKVLFLQSISVLATASTTKDRDQASSLKQAGSNILSAQVTKTTYDSGNFGSEQSTVEKILSKDFVGKVKSGDLSVLRNYTINQFDPNSQPGLALVILSVAADAARSESSRLQTREQHLHDLRDIISAGLQSDQISQTTDNTRIFLKMVTQNMSESATVIDTLNSLSRIAGQYNAEAKQAQDKAKQAQDKAKQTQQTIFSALNVVSDYAIDSTIGLDHLELLTEQVTNLDHSYSITRSMIDAQERELLISRGVQGLVIYEQNGITSDEIANLIRAAQTLALTAIAAGVF